MRPCKIVLAEDHVMFRQMVRQAMVPIPNIEVVGEACDGIECIEVLKGIDADMVILGTTLPGPQGLGAIREIKSMFPDVKVLVLTMHKSKLHISRALSSGADGYLLKENTFEHLIDAIEKVRQGDSYISDLIACQVMELLREGSFSDRSQPTKPLTLREKEILELVVEGKSAREIADCLSVSIMTVYNHRINIKKKLGARKDVDLIKRAMQDGYLPLQAG